jgi:hypothetical protein
MIYLFIYFKNFQIRGLGVMVVQDVAGADQREWKLFERTALFLKTTFFEDFVCGSLLAKTAIPAMFTKLELVFQIKAFPRCDCLDFKLCPTSKQ